MAVFFLSLQISFFWTRGLKLPNRGTFCGKKGGALLSWRASVLERVDSVLMCMDAGRDRLPDDHAKLIPGCIYYGAI